MSKVLRPRIARGSKLYREHVGNPLLDAASKLEGNVEPGEIKENMGSFWIGPLTIPAITSTFQSRLNQGELDRNAYLIPFLVPPLRDGFEVSSGQPVYSKDTEPVVLDAISFGFDNRDEKAPVTDHRNAAAAGAVNYADAGKLNYDTPPTHPYTISVAIYQKEQYFFQDPDLKSATGVYPKDKAYALGAEVWRYDFSGLEVLMDQGKPNPFLVQDVGIELDRYSTYTIAIHTSLGNPSATLYQSFALVGATIGLRCLHKLVPADDASASTFGPLGVQNKPTKAGSNLSLSGTPGTGVIGADDSSTGIATLMGSLDEVAQAGLVGGCTREGEPAVNRSIKHDSCYEVIAIPLMQNRARGGIGSYTNGGALTSDVVGEPYIVSTGVAGNVAGNILEDVRIVPIKAPLTIHNIFLAWSWDYFLQETDSSSLSSTYSHIPSSSTMQVKVGVAIGEGIGSDSVNYQQIASHTMLEPIDSGGSGEPSAAFWDSRLVDRVASMGSSAGPTRLAANISLWGHEIHQLPIIAPTGALPAAYGAGTYYQQGEPFWMSRAWTGTGSWLGAAAARTNVNLPTGGPAVAGQPPTGGRETFLEVRMQITDTLGKLIDYGSTNREVISGYGGHWLYIIGKKQLVGDY